MTKTCNKAVPNRIIIRISHYNRNCVGRLLHGKRRSNAEGDYAVGLETDQFNRQMGELIEPALGKAPFDHEVLFLDVAALAQGLSKCLFGVIPGLGAICEIA